MYFACEDALRKRGGDLGPCVDWARQLQATDEAYQAPLYSWVGVAIGDSALFRPLQESLVLLRGIDPAMQPVVYQGIGRGLLFPTFYLFHTSQTSWFHAALNRIDPIFHPAIYEGLGKEMYVLYGEDDAFSRDLIREGIAPAFRAVSLRAYERAKAHFEQGIALR